MTRESEIMEASEKYCKPFEAIQPTGNIAFRTGAKWADKTMIEKACEYLRGKTRLVKKHIGKDLYLPLLSEEEIEKFRKAMEE